MDLTAPLFEVVGFSTPFIGAIQFWFAFQTFVVLGMGIWSFIYPGSDAITMGGYWEYVGEKKAYNTKKTVNADLKKKGKVLAPNARGWAVRSAFGGVMNIIAMYYGTRECYVIMAACAAFRETVDSIGEVMEGRYDRAFVGYKIEPVSWKKFPPIIYFPPWVGGAVANFAFLYILLNA